MLSRQIFWLLEINLITNLYELRVHVISELFKVILLLSLIDVGHIQGCIPPR